MLLNENLKTTASDSLHSDVVEQELEKQVKSFYKKSNNRLQMVWLKDKNGNLTAHWTTQD